MSFNPNVWVKGFQPPSVCPNCKRVGMLTFTGQVTPNADHIYKCLNCNSLIGSPSDYGYCAYFQMEIHKDIFFTPCVKCPHRRVTEHEPICVHFSLRKGYQDTEMARAIEQTMRKVRKAHLIDTEVGKPHG